MNRRKAVLGLVDAAASSLATFAAGVAAVRLLNGAELGAYALVFSAWLLASQVTPQLLLVPAEAKLVAVSDLQRIASLRRNLLLSVPSAAFTAVAMLPVWFLVPAEVPDRSAAALLATGAVVAAILPLQEHGRRLFHLGRRHAYAAAVSVVRLVVAVASLAGGWKFGLKPSLLPFGALALGDIAALILAVIFSRRAGEGSAEYSWRELLESGRWLLAGASFGPGAGFVVSSLVTHLAGATELGTAEAARVAAQPILVLALGLSAVARPSSMEAAMDGEEARARRIGRGFWQGLAVMSLIYGGLTLLPARVNVLARLMPASFTVPGLVQLSVLAALVNGAVFLHRSELIAMDKSRQLSNAEAMSSAGRAGLASAAAALREWTVPLSFLVGGILRWVRLDIALRDAYRTRSGTGDAGRN